MIVYFSISLDFVVKRASIKTVEIEIPCVRGYIYTCT